MSMQVPEQNILNIFVILNHIALRQSLLLTQKLAHVA